MTVLADVAGTAPFIFVVGKGGVGKTTAAAALALELADAGTEVHLISTDPAHSLGDVMAEPAGPDPVASRCNARLTLEEFDAPALAARWLQHATDPVARLLEAGTYLDAEDIAGFTRLALPGVDEMMAVLRLVDLADGGARVVVDTAPTGHTLRLLDAGETHATLARALRAMADKAAVVASSMVGRELRLREERFIEELEAYAMSFRHRVLEPAVFVVATRGDAVVAAETLRLRRQLAGRHLQVAAVVRTGSAAPPDRNDARMDDARMDDARMDDASGRDEAVALQVPLLSRPTGCDGLRRWRAALGPAWSGPEPPAVPGTQHFPASPAASPEAMMLATGTSAVLPWLLRRDPSLLVFAGKGGVGKSTCAAATAVALAATRPVLLCSADPAGSLEDMFAGGPVPGVRLLQVDAGRALGRLRTEFREEVLGALADLGLSASATLDRRVVESLWDLAPPGIDELAAVAALVDAGDTGEVVVVDTAPTGHFLRLLAMPDLALDWVRQLMRVIVKYQAAGTAAGVAESLLRIARELKAFRSRIHESAHTGVLVVTLDEPVVRAETSRLQSALADAGVPVWAVLVNRTGSAPGSLAAPGGIPAIHAPSCPVPPVGGAALREFFETWKIGT